MAAKKRILIANRSEIAIRLQTAILQLGHTPLGIYTSGEGPHAPHLVHLPDQDKLAIPGHGAAAYLNIASLVKTAKQANADAVIPGYGFLSESAEFAQAVIDAGMIWIGPDPNTLRLFGDKHAAKEFARTNQVPVLPSTSSDASLDEIEAFARGLPPGSRVLLKALAGGGGRGIRVVDSRQTQDLADAYHSCKREAKAAFGDDRLFAEPFLTNARHIEVQVVGDGTGQVVEFGERECTLQRRHQKIIEICPSPTLRTHSQLRNRIIASAKHLASAAKLRTLATVEFLVTVGAATPPQYYFLETNPRIQVEHTITEQVYGIDLAATQIQLALGAQLSAFPNLTTTSSPLTTTTSIQLRLNAERFHSDGTSTGTQGQITALSFPLGPGVRIDTAAHPPMPPPVGNFKQSLDFDSLLAKLIFTAPSYESAINKATRGLSQVQCDGVATNKALLTALLCDGRVRANTDIHTRYIEENVGRLHAVVKDLEQQWQQQKQVNGVTHPTSQPTQSVSLAPLPQGQVYLNTPLAGRVISVAVSQGAAVRKGDTIAVLESMKMEHTVRAEDSGIVAKVLCSVGSDLSEETPVLIIETSDEHGDSEPSEAETMALQDTSDARQRLLTEYQELHNQSRDDHPYRQSSTSKRHAKGHRTARENLYDLIDADSFIEYGELVVAAQRTRLEGEALERTRNDGVITGWATINVGSNDASPAEKRTKRCAVVVYDYGVLAGTQGHFHHGKLDRIFHSVLANPAPVVIYAEGGGGRPGDLDVLNLKASGLEVPSFGLLARIKARGIPIVTIANGNVFAGNAALLGCGDVIIATRHPDTSIGMGGPAMIEGGGLGKVAARDVGPVSVHDVNGNIDIVVADEKEATALAKRIVSVFQGASDELKSVGGNTTKSETLRSLMPSSRKRAYDIRPILEALTDDEFGFVEMGAAWGKSLVTGFIRVQGTPLAVVGSSVVNELGGAIDARSADKGTRFIDMLTRTKCSHLLALCDTPGEYKIKDEHRAEVDVSDSNPLRWNRLHGRHCLGTSGVPALLCQLLHSEPSVPRLGRPHLRPSAPQSVWSRCDGSTRWLILIPLPQCIVAHGRIRSNGSRRCCETWDA